MDKSLLTVELFTRYTIYHVVVSSQNGDVKKSYTSRTAITDDSVSSTRTPVIGGGGVLTDGWIVAIALLALVVLALLILMIWCIYRSCRRRRYDIMRCGGYM